MSLIQNRSLREREDQADSPPGLLPALSYSHLLGIPKGKTVLKYAIKSRQILNSAFMYDYSVFSPYGFRAFI